MCVANNDCSKLRISMKKKIEIDGIDRLMEDEKISITTFMLDREKICWIYKKKATNNSYLHSECKG